MHVPRPGFGGTPSPGLYSPEAFPPSPGSLTAAGWPPTTPGVASDGGGLRRGWPPTGPGVASPGLLPLYPAIAASPAGHISPFKARLSPAGQSWSEVRGQPRLHFTKHNSCMKQIPCRHSTDKHYTAEPCNSVFRGIGQDHAL